MPTRAFRVLRLLVAGSAVLVIALSAASAQSIQEKKKGLYGTVVDEEGKAIAGIVVQLSETADMANPMEITTTDRGFVYPRLSSDPRDYYLRIKSAEWFIRKYRLKVRRLSGEIWQDDEGHLIPGAEDKLPALRYRGGNAQADLTLGKITEFKKMQAQAAQQGQVSKEISLEKEAEEAYALGDYKGAADKLAKSLEVNPNDPERHWLRAQVLAKAGENDAAIKEARAALALKQDMKDVRLRLADWVYENGKTDEAIRLLEKERELSPENASVYKRLSAYYKESDQPDASEQAVAKWAEVAPDDTEAMIALAQVKAAHKDFAASEQIYRKLAEKDPGEAYRMFYNVGASIWNAKGDVGAAIAVLKKSVELKADFPKSRKLLGDALLNQGKLAEARAQYEKFVELAPGDPQAGEIKKMIAGLPKN